MSRSARRILSLAVLLPALLVSALGTSFATWRCRYDGVVREKCCCPTDAHQTPAAPGPAISGVGCCEVQHHHIDRAPSDLSRRAPEIAAAALVALPAIVLPTLDAFSPQLPTRAPERERPPAGRALVLRKHAFLI